MNAQFTIIGNLTGDPELRYTQNGLGVANFTVAHTPKIFDKTTRELVDGEPMFIRCSVWREFAEHVASSLVRGCRVIVTGTLKQRSYETQAGEKRTTFELDVDGVGPDLRFVSASIQRAATSAAVPAAADSWVPGDDETPF